MCQFKLGIYLSLTGTFFRVHDVKKWTEFALIEFEPKPFEDYDIDIKIEYCGVCGSDVSTISRYGNRKGPALKGVQVHTITGGWGQPSLVCLSFHSALNSELTMSSPSFPAMKSLGRWYVWAPRLHRSRSVIVLALGTCLCTTADKEDSRILKRPDLLLPAMRELQT